MSPGAPLHDVRVGLVKVTGGVRKFPTAFGGQPIALGFALGRAEDEAQFRLGEIEALPLADASVDAVGTNCVINLSPEKPRVFQEARRVLKAGGRLVISDVVLREGGKVPEGAGWPECAAGAVPASDYRRWLEAAGFASVEVLDRGEYSCGVDDLWVAIIHASKPGSSQAPLIGPWGSPQNQSVV